MALMGEYSKVWDDYKPYWVRNGARRPLPSLYQAIEKYGHDKVMFFAPDYVPNRYCKYCGKKIENKRRKSYCSDECSRDFNGITVWGRGRGAYAMRILYRDKFTCQDCGEIHAFKNEYGIYLPVDDGKLDIHHIVPVSMGGGDEPSNLITLCHDCHMHRHKLLKENMEDNNNATV